MKIQSQTDGDLKRLAEKLEGQRFAMLTLQEPSGELTARPLTPLEMDEEGSFWFFASRTALGPLVGTGIGVNLAFSDEAHATYVSIVGRASLVDDASLKAALWTAAARPWFDGDDDPDLVLLRVAPLRAEVWDAPDSKAVRLAAMAASVLAGRPIGMGDKETIDTRR